MKELSIEEKAKRYDEAKARISIAYNSNRCTIGFMNEIFPELKESADERMRKELLNYLYDVHDDDEERARWINWLEKQNEQKPIDKIHLGKKYKCIASPRYSTFMTGKIYKPEDKFLCSLMNFCSDCFEPIEEGEQKPAWSEEDENMISDLNVIIHIYFSGISCIQFEHDLSEDKVRTWFKSLKDRVQPQSLTVTDEELAQAKKDAYNDALDKIEYHSGGPTFDDGWSAAIWYLKKKNK